jgi:imidazolonepropionase-like amidohydrolase
MRLAWVTAAGTAGRRQRRSLSWTAALAFGMGAAGLAAADDTAVAFRGVTVLSMTGALPLDDGTVVVVGGRIKAVGPRRSLSLPRGARIVEGRGRWLMPGLWDSHVHLSKTRASAMGLFIANGITSVRDAGGRPRRTSALATRSG